MRRLERFSEPIPHHGALAGRGAALLLKPPQEIDPLTILVRETFQNSWDARAGKGAISYRIGALTPTPTQRAAVNDALADRPGQQAGFSPQLAARETVLMVEDFGTTGLTGPMRASGTGQSRFGDFVFMIGAQKQTSAGVALGGAFGFGKTIAFLVSTRHTVLAYTRCSARGGETSRIIAMALSPEPYTSKQTAYTGRHWWGTLDTEGHVVGLEDGAADELAVAVGFNPRSKGDTGTSLMILAPSYGVAVDEADSDAPVIRDAEGGMAHIRQAILWNCWPKLTGSQPAANVELTLEREVLELPHPSEVAPLRTFVQAFDAVRRCRSQADTTKWAAEDKSSSIVIQQKRPSRRLGVLAMALGPYTPGDLQGGDGQTANGFRGPAHHVALMRPVELVVEYRPVGPDLGAEGLEWGGVFICDDDLNAAFASAEPSTHTTWSSSNAPLDADKRAIRAALREIDRAAEERFDASARPAGASSELTCARVASLLGDLMGPALHGLDPSRQSGASTTAKKKGGAKARAVRPSVHLSPPIIDRDKNGGGILLVPVLVEPHPRGPSYVLGLEVAVATGDRGTPEGPAPAGAQPPAVQTWFREDRRSKRELPEGPPPIEPGAQPIRLIALVRNPEDAALTLTPLLTEVVST